MNYIHLRAAPRSFCIDILESGGYLNGKVREYIEKYSAEIVDMYGVLRDLIIDSAPSVRRNDRQDPRQDFNKKS